MSWIQIRPKSFVHLWYQFEPPASPGSWVIIFTNLDFQAACLPHGLLRQRDKKCIHLGRSRLSGYVYIHGHQNSKCWSGDVISRFIENSLSAGLESLKLQYLKQPQLRKCLHLLSLRQCEQWVNRSFTGWTFTKIKGLTKTSVHF